MSAARKLDTKLLRKHLHAKGTRFATPEELMEKTGLVPGSVPPFGEPILPFSLYGDTSIRDNDRIAFNAGELTRSVILSTADYLHIADPKEVSFFTTVDK